MSIILNGQTNDITVGGVGLTLDTESELKADKSTTLTEHFSKQNKKAVVFTKTAPAGFSVLPNKVELPNGTIANNTNTVSLSLNSNIDTGSKVAGTDYYVYCTDSNIYNISTDKTKTDGTIIGGFHYGLTTEAESPTGNKTEADMVQIRGINAYSFWDLKYRPNNENTNAMVKIGNSWYDIYQMDSEYGINKYSRAGATIAGGTADYGRAIPKIPLAYGGNGTVTYGKFTWFQAGEVAIASGKRKISYNEFGSIAYGVTEGVSSQTNGYETVVGRIEHYPHLTSKYGIEQVSGTQWIWGADVGGNYGTTDWAWKNNTDTRGQIYSTSNNPTAVILGGYRGDGAYAGSRASGWGDYVWDSYWLIGCRFTCDHLEEI